MTFPLIKTFRATSVFKAFILNALAVAIIATLSTEVRYLLQNDKTRILMRNFYSRTSLKKVVLSSLNIQSILKILILES